MFTAPKITPEKEGSQEDPFLIGMILLIWLHKAVKLLTEFIRYREKIWGFYAATAEISVIEQVAIAGRHEGHVKPSELPLL